MFLGMNKKKPKGNTSSLQSYALKFGPLHFTSQFSENKYKVARARVFGYSWNSFGVKATAGWAAQVDFSLSSPIFWTLEYFLHDDLKQPGGQDSGQEKQQGIEPCTFFSKK